MKTFYVKSFALALACALQQYGAAQCAATSTLGSASNMFTQIRNGTNPVAADKNLNTIVFIHRNNATAFGATSGHLRYDVSTNGGSTWSNDLGTLNPINTSLARYPNVAIYNPTLNTTPANAYLGYMAATINGASAWNGQVSGVMKLNGTGNTEAYNQSTAPPALIANSIVKGAPGIFWAIDGQFNGSYVTGYNIYKGTWNSTTSDINWVTNYTVTPPFNTALAAIPLTGDYNIAFDPTGMIGWFSFLGQVTPGPANYAYYPVFYKTIDGGLTWTGPIQVDLNTLSCISSNIAGGNVPTTNIEHDLAVDINGNPHMLTTICNGSNFYSYNYSLWHHMFDITQVNGVWTAYDIANVNAAEGLWGASPNIATQDMTPQVSRTADGSKIFFSWTDNASYALGTNNTTPDLFGRGYDVVAQKWTNVKNFTACNPATAGLIFFPHVAEEVLEPSANNYKLAPVYGEYTTANDPAQISNFRFLDNITYTGTDFSITQPVLAVSITQGSNVIACPSTPVTLSIGGLYNTVLWSNGMAGGTIMTNTPGQYIVAAESGCTLGSDTIMVTALSATVSVSNSTVCAGSSVTLTAAGNGLSYSWLPSTSTGTIDVVNPTASTIYSLVALGDQNCTGTFTSNVAVNPLPTLTVAGNNTICAGSVITQTVSGAATYTWNGSTPGNTVALTPTATTVYSVTGTDANNCTNSATVSITALAPPTITTSATQTMICMGQSVTVSAGGAANYTVTSPSFSMVQSSSPPVNSPVSILFTPSISATYVFNGTNADGCFNTAMITVSVSACTGFESMNGAAAFDLLIYPNPSQGEFQLSAQGSMELSVINEMGQTVRKISLSQQNDYRSSVSELASGIYFITGQYNGYRVNQKLVVAK